MNGHRAMVIVVLAAAASSVSPAAAYDEPASVVKGVSGAANRRVVVSYSQMELEDLHPRYGGLSPVGMCQPLLAPRDLPLPDELQATVPRHHTFEWPGAFRPRVSIGCEQSDGDARICIRNRSGALLSSVSLEAFWSELGVSIIGVPAVHYDPGQDRWIVCSVAEPFGPDSSLLLGVSQTADPLGVWTLYRVDVDECDQTWADHPSLGFNYNWITVQVNRFTAFGIFADSSIFVFGKAALYGGGAGNYTRFARSDIGATQVPALTYDETAEEQYLVNVWNTGSDTLRLYSIAGDIGGETMSLGGFMVDSEDWPGACSSSACWSGPDADLTVRSHDKVIRDVIYCDGLLWIATETDHPDGACTECQQCPSDGAFASSG